jgi:hypothetical protein
VVITTVAVEQRDRVAGQESQYARDVFRGLPDQGQFHTDGQWRIHMNASGVHGLSHNKK